MQKQFYVDKGTESSCFEGQITGDGHWIWTVAVDPHYQQGAQLSLLGAPRGGSSGERREGRELRGTLASLSEKIQQEAEEHEVASGELSGPNLESQSFLNVNCRIWNRGVTRIRSGTPGTDSGSE